MAQNDAPIATISLELATIAERPGWTILSSWRDGFASVATIAKDGVLLTFMRIKSDNEDSVRLQFAVHPAVALDFYRQPSIREIIDGIDVEWNTDRYFTLVADHLAAVKRYLSDPHVHEKRVLAQAADLRQRYAMYQNARPTIAATGRSLLRRHPWLASDAPLSFSSLVRGSSAPFGIAIADRLRKRRLALVLMAVFIGSLAARWL